MRAAWAILSLTVSLTCFADSGAFDLIQIAQLNGRGQFRINSTNRGSAGHCHSDVARTQFRS
jgi:hypothetical protein